ncbi:hypothetical protein [Streptomyces sp. NPDC057253]|uniref:glycosyl hydrolase family 95 catalytic domain-containing protein n=1 Tax=Streptomyces sp. NPDC057253 TaxID=3346069 RepID=UPI00362C303A
MAAQRSKSAPNTAGSGSVIDVALLERLYDSGRYLFVSSSGVLPPRLTGIWTGSWNGAWADDFTTGATSTSRWPAAPSSISAWPCRATST